MKRESQRVLLIEVLLAIIAIFTFFIIKGFNMLVYLAILLIPLGLCIWLLGYHQREERASKDVLLTIIIWIILYYLITYILGYFIGFLKNGYSMTLKGILANVIEQSIFIVIIEFIRVSLAKKCKYYKKGLVLATIVLSAIELVTKFSLGQINSRLDLLDTSFTVILPVLCKNAFLTYLGYKTSVGNNIIYRILMELPTYIIPIIPNLGNYLSNTVLTVIPILLLYYLNKTYFSKKEKIIDSRRDLKRRKFGALITVLLVVILSFMIALVSGVGRYLALTIGSGSMTGTIDKGDVVVLDKKDKKVSEGNIVAFKKEGVILVHRVVDIQNIHGVRYYHTKGDYNKTEDNWLVEDKDIVGKYKFKFKFIGWPTVKLNEWILGGD